MINAWEKLAHVAWQDISARAHKLGAAVERAVSTFANPVCVSVEDEAALKLWLDDLNQSMVDHPVAERCGANQAALGFSPVETSVRSRTIQETDQIFL
jgi:hypothetical protein